MSESSGILIVDKPQGVTSHDVVAAARAALHMKKVGHAGTLDPMATGVLIIGFGHATRLLNYIVDHHKTYEATVRFGQRTTTDDADGEILASDGAGHLPTPDELKEAVAQHFTGTIQQVPNAYSAIKVHGQRAYDLMRAGKDVQLEARKITVDNFEVLDVRSAQAQDGTSVVDADVRVQCSAGTYIRALGRDLGELFGCGAHLTRLRRLAVGRFHADDAHVLHAHTETKTFTNREGETVSRLRAVLDCTPQTLAQHELSMLESVERTMPVVDVTAREAQDLRYGRWIARRTDTIAAAVEREGADVVAIVEPADARHMKPVTVFPAEPGERNETHESH